MPVPNPDMVDQSSSDVPPGYFVDDQGRLRPIDNPLTDADLEQVAGGKQSTEPSPAPTPNPTGTGSGGGSTGGGGGATAGSSGIYTPWDQTYKPPSMLDLGGKPGLSYIPPVPQFNFNAPSMEDALNDTGYKFTYDEGLRALDQGAAGRGLLNTTGTLRGEQRYGQAAATQQYGNVYNRALNLSQLKFQPLMHEYDTLSSAGQRQDELNNSRAWDQYLERYREYTDWQNSDWQRKYQAASL